MLLDRADAEDADPAAALDEPLAAGGGTGVLTGVLPTRG
jgi:hypothetical protein